MNRIYFMLPAIAIFFAVPAYGEDLGAMSIAELMSINVTSPAKKEQKVSETASAVFVITAEDIRRSGVTSIPEALRMVPGMEVARIGAYRWAITSRGLNDAFANYLLVMIDGRTVYSPMFGGVFWDAQDTMLEDIDRIEVVRGPGASLWGANAVNGVINIITKSSKDTQGALISGGGGTEEVGFTSVRYGGAVDESTSYRAYGKWYERDNFEGDQDSGDAGAWRSYRGGFRVDSDLSEDNLVTVQGDLYKLTERQSLQFDPSVAGLVPEAFQPADKEGANILGRFTRVLSDTSDMQLQVYYDYTDREDSSFVHEARTLDVDLQHRFSPLEDHDLVWGLGYRSVDTETDGNIILSFDPEERRTDLYTWFIQDEITAIEDELRFILGSKFEINEYTDFEFQPTVRAIWTPNEYNTLWIAGSRAVHTPTRMEDGISSVLTTLPPSVMGVPTFVKVYGDDAYEAVELYALELGYRAQLRDDLSFDVATYYNYYPNYTSGEFGEPFVDVVIPLPIHAIVPVTLENNLKAESHGVELTLDYMPLDWWRLVGTFAYINVNTFGTETTDDSIYRTYAGRNPDFQLMLRSHFDLPADLEIDGAIRFVDETNVSESYWEGDLRLAWLPCDYAELSVVGQNLFDNAHREWTEARFGQPSVLVERGVYGKVTLKF